MNRKSTAWRKNKKLGDVSGGRRWLKIEDRILNRVHSLKPPPTEARLPIVIEENPSRDFFFPVSGREVLDRLRQFPAEDVEGLTHIWLRRIKPKKPRLALAEYLRGSGVCAIVLYAWPKTLLQEFGPSSPTRHLKHQYAQWTTDWIHLKNRWFLRWTEPALRDFYLTALLGHEIGHHCDHRYRSKAKKRQGEEFAEQYVLEQIRLKQNDA